MSRAFRSALIGAVCLAGLAPPGLTKDPADWRLLLRARPRDHDRLRDWRLTWMAALAQARAAGEGARIEAEGALLQPDVALVPPDVPPGDYRCRSIRLGAVAPGVVPVPTNPWHHPLAPATPLPPGAATFVALPAVPCRITANGLTMLAGVQRPAGRIYPWDGLRDLFLGAAAVGDESSALPYGRDPDRNLVGFVDRIGPARWRLVLPRPAWGAQIEIVEVLPAGG